MSTTERCSSRWSSGGGEGEPPGQPTGSLTFATATRRAAAIPRTRRTRARLEGLGEPVARQDDGQPRFWIVRQPRQRGCRMPYPTRPSLGVLDRFAGTAKPRQSRDERRQLLQFVVEGYARGQSLRMLADLTGRSQTAIRRALDQAGVRRRRPGAPRLHA